MTYEQLQAYLMRFFSDTSRPQNETKEGLLSLVDEIDVLIQTLDDDGTEAGVK